MNGGIGQFARVLDATLAEQASPASAVIDTDSDGGAWQRELIHSPNISCSCCGGPAHACAIYAAALAETLRQPAAGESRFDDALADSATGDDSDPYSAELLWPARGESQAEEANLS